MFLAGISFWLLSGVRFWFLLVSRDPRQEHAGMTPFLGVYTQPLERVNVWKTTTFYPKPAIFFKIPAFCPKNAVAITKIHA
jgi:hypothetical protein